VHPEECLILIILRPKLPQLNPVWMVTFILQRKKEALIFSL